MVAALLSAAAIGICAAIFLPTAFTSSHSFQVTKTVRYLGVFEPDAPQSYATINQFADAIGRQPNVVPYYSHWLEPFQTQFATTAVDHGAMPLVQIAPNGIPVADIASGQYDQYLTTYAEAVKAFRSRVILSFGHEMNGTWYSWGFRHTSSAAFVAAWRHIVTIFNGAGASNVTWLWTINILGKPNLIPDPTPWWPGKAYVNWVGVDGYYWTTSSGFSSVFGPTIAKVRELTHDPILIAETGAAPATGQSEKLADLFSGVRTYGLLGFIWFNDNTVSAAIRGEHLNWQLSPASLASLRQDAIKYMK